MFRLSKLLEKLEDKLDARFKSWFARDKAKLPMRIPAVIVGWYFYGMFLNSLRLGIASTFHQTGEEIQSIWVLNPFKNWGAVFTGFGIVTTLVIILIICLITKKDRPPPRSSSPASSGSPATNTRMTRAGLTFSRTARMAHPAS